ncbi:hypothetical protein K1719_039602 [Acacia pycnantha]|nr:hypothetical protein K1719_039602 [Acacia pycnantha]
MPAPVLIFIFVFANALHCNEATLLREENGSAVAVVVHDQASPMAPVSEVGKMEVFMLMNESRRKLGSFQICALCTCCGGTKGVCLPSPCCYAINCNIPNRPFGFCSFTPKTFLCGIRWCLVVAQSNAQCTCRLLPIISLKLKTCGGLCFFPALRSSCSLKSYNSAACGWLLCLASSIWQGIRSFAVS